MIELLERMDPAIDLDTDRDRLRAKVDERLGLSVRMQPHKSDTRRGWLVAVAAVVGVIALTVPIVIRSSASSIFDPMSAVLGDIQGADAAVALASGGVQTMVVDGETIWVVTALQHELQQISSKDGAIQQTYPIGAYVEGLVVGGGHLWLLSYDNGGEVLRFDPESGQVDAIIPIGGEPRYAATWFANGLWVSNENSELLEISPAGEVLSTRPGELKGVGFGYLWVNDPATGLVSSLGADGLDGDLVIPTYEGLETMSGWGVRKIVEAGGFLWLMDGDFPWGTNLSRFDPDSGELTSVGGLTFGLLDILAFDDALWLTSNTDHLLIRMDLSTGVTERYPLPGKPGGLVEADGSLWVTLYQPGMLLRLDPGRMIESGEVVSDDWELFPHRLVCTGDPDSERPTILLEAAHWISYGSWSVVQAELSAAGYLVCANGYVEGDRTPGQRADELSEALTAEGIPGPFVLVAAGDGVHSIRLFADGRDDIAGVVLVDPTPIGFQDAYDELLPDFGHPPWLDLDPEVSKHLDDFGDVPLVLISQDPEAVFLSRTFIVTAGKSVATEVNQLWQDGLTFYASLSTDSVMVVANGTGMDAIIWSSPNLIASETRKLVDGSE